MEAGGSKAKTIFLGALELGSEAERRAYVERHCGGDGRLREEVESLLEHHGDTGGFLESASADLGVNDGDAPVVDAGPGTQIGPYKLLEALGEGGMGVVYMAEQREPVMRHVALKIVKPGMDSRQVVARFEAERQALALMDHPHIARVLDAGTTHGGRPYFVMELVKGVPIHRYCDERRLSLRERLELFVPVCQAVQHAHQKGIIHRDLKPTNVLVTDYDHQAVPKIIDFGVAKALHQQLTEKTLFTHYGQIVGTLEYMSPEQAKLNQLDVDTRSDVYSLGVLLYELVAGSTPFGKEWLGSAAIDELLRVIREVEPPKPSTKLSSSEELASIAARRQIEPKKLAKQVHGELDWIVMKCLEKDRARRYETASSLALDVLRYLHDEPVLAGPPSAGYRLRKFARKHRTALATAAAFVFILAGGVVASVWQAVNATVSAQLAHEAETDARANEAKAEEEARKAKQSEEEARSVLRFFGDKVLRAARPKDQQGGLGREATIRAAVEAAEPGIEEAFRDRPLVEATIRNTLGVTYGHLGESALALRQLERALLLRQALDPDHPDRLQSMNNLAEAYMETGRIAEALALHEETLKDRKAKLGPDHPRTLHSMNNLAEAYQAAGRIAEALALHEETLKLRKAKLGPDHLDTLYSMNNLAAAYMHAGRLAEALPLFEETLKLTKANLGPDHPDTLTSMNNLALAYQNGGRLADALPLHEETLKLMKARLGPDHPRTLASMNNLARAYQAAGRLAEALVLHEETLKLLKAKFGPDHPNTLTSMSNVAGAYRSVGRLSEALPLHEETLTLMKAKFGPDHPETVSSMGMLGAAYLAAGRLDEALSLLEETLRLMKARLGPDHPDTLIAMNNLGAAYKDAGQLTEAISLHEETLTLRRATLGPDHPNTFASMQNLASAYQAAGRPAEALPLHEEMVKLTKAKFGLEHRATLGSMNNLAMTFMAANRSPEAEPILRELVAIQRRRLPADSPELASSLASLGKSLVEADKHAEAEPILRECLAIREKTLPEDWRRFSAQSLLGGSLLGQKKYAEAEPLLLSGYEGMKAREEALPTLARDNLPQALERLVKLHEALGQPEKAAERQLELDRERPRAKQ